MTRNRHASLRAAEWVEPTTTHGGQPVNVLWAADSIAFLAGGLSAPTTVGAVWIVMQALVVAGFAGLQVITRGAARERALAA
jgi:hypothetical protein